MTVKSPHSPRVVLANMGNIGECPQIAQALYDGGMLAKWYVGTYYSSNPLYLWQRWVPELKRRHYPTIDERLIEGVGGWEWTRLALRRAPLLSATEKRERQLHLIERFTKATAQRLSRVEADIVIGVNNNALELFEAARRRRIKTVLSQRTLHPRIMQSIVEEELHFRAIKSHRFFEENRRRYVERCSQEIDVADMVLCPSQSVIDSMIEAGVSKEKLRYLPFGVNVNRFDGVTRSAETNKQEVRLLFVGRIDYLKGIPYLIDAVQQLDLPWVTLALIGAPRGLNPKQFAQLPSVTHKGWTAPHKLNQYYVDADIFVLPSLSEGSALVGYEAMAAGLPIVTTTHAGTLVRDGIDGFIVPPRDSNALAEKIALLAHDTERSVAMGKSARNRVLNYGWEGYQSRLRSILLNDYPHGEIASSIFYEKRREA